MTALTIIFSLMFILPLAADKPAYASSKEAKIVARTAPSSAKSVKSRPQNEGEESPEAPSSGEGPGIERTEGHFPPFNGGWRWVYRKKAIAVLRQELYKDDAFEAYVFKNVLGLTGSGKKTLTEEALARTGGSEDNGDAGEAETVRNIVSFYNGEMDVHAFNSSLSHANSLEYRLLGKFLVGYHYEKTGFYPEAQGYYSVASKEGKDGFVRSAALFAGARLNYMEGRFSRAKRLLRTSLAENFPGARIWLANTLLIKGEEEEAWNLYSEGTDRAIEDFDSITVVSLADMLMLKRKYGEARSLFTFLRLKHETEPFLDAFFDMKNGDALLAEGRGDEALKAYSNVGDRYRTGEGWAMSSLSKADVLVLKGDKGSLSRALAIYDELSKSGLPGSDYAYLGAASVKIKLGRFDDVLGSADLFSSMYPDSPLKSEMQGYKSEAISRMLDSMYAAGDHLAVVRLFMKHGASIPFGRKAEGYLKAGRSFAALGLWPDAVNRLNSAIKIGKDDVVEEAMITLARAYIEQRDAGAAERLLNGFITRYPRSVHKAEAQTILFKAAFDRGEYEKVALAGNPPAGAEGLMLKARAMDRLGRHKEALVVYEQAAAELREKGDRRLLVQAYLGAADASFTLGRYAGAADGYKKAVGAMEGPDKGIYKSWALYRMARSYSILRNDSGKEESLKELTGLGSEFGGMAAPVLKEAGGL